MASNMIWAHELIHLLHHGTMNTMLFFAGIVLTILFTLIIRQQVFIDDKQWLRRMISHHSTALTTSLKIKDRTDDDELKKLSQEIIDTQEKEITQMTHLLTK